MFILILALPCALAAEGQRPSTPSGVPLENVEEFIDDYVSDYIGQTSPGLAVVVVKDGKILFSKGYGYSDVEKNLMVDPANTIFEYGSVSKVFVYTAIMRLVEEGKLDLDTDIRTYLPTGFLKKLRYDEPITLTHVMNHTTGFEDYLFDVVVTSHVRQSFEQTLRSGQPEQVYRPGTVSAYSNYAVALAAYIVQGVVKQDFHGYVMDNIFLPSGMERTSAHPEFKDIPWLTQNKAMGYYPLGGGEFGKGEWSYIPLYPVGSVNGTAEDLARFAITLMPEDGEECVLFKEHDTLTQMFSQSHAMGPGLTGFAHGFIEFDGRSRGVGHGGNTAFFTAQMNIVPEERFGVIVLANAASEMDLTQGLTKALLGENQSGMSQYEGSLPDAGDVEGNYISARRAHNGFLKLYGFFSLLSVHAIDRDTIELRFAGQSAKYVQTAPYIYKQVEANGAIFKYNFGTVYFDIKDGTVQRVSGDFLPLPTGHTLSWLLVDGIIVTVSMLFFLCTLIVILILTLFRRKKNSDASALVRHIRRFYVIFVSSGAALLINNAILVIRMLVNNYRSFSEVRLHIILNYPIVLFAVAAGVITVFFGKKSGQSKKRWFFYIFSVGLLTALIAVLFKWHFFNMLI